MSVDVEVAHPGPCIEPRDGFLDLKTFLYRCFMSMMVKDKDKDYISEEELSVYHSARS